MRFMLLFTLFFLVTPTFAQTPANPPRGELRVVLLSDFNGSYGATDYSPAVARVHQAPPSEVWQPDLFLSAGDVVAGQKTSLPDARVSRKCGRRLTARLPVLCETRASLTPLRRVITTGRAGAAPTEASCTRANARRRGRTGRGLSMRSAWPIMTGQIFPLTTPFVFTPPDKPD